MSSPDATWRVYLAEWLTVYTGDASGPEGMDECLEHFRHKYAGRVREGDWLVIGAEGPHCLQLQLPNLRGEYKDYDRAMSDPARARLCSWLVQRGSAEEQELLDYGKKMLPDGG